eukprot:6491627-Amphidinium_carterae.2
MAHVPLTPGRPQQSGHIERSGGMVKELFECMLLESKLPRNLFCKIAIEQAAFALNVVVDKSGESAFSRALEEQSWVIPLAFGWLSWVRRNVRLNEVPSEHDQGKLYPAVFLSWVILPGTVPQWDVIVIPWSTLKHALVHGTWRGWRRVRRVRDYYRSHVLQFPVSDLLKTFAAHQATLEESVALDPNEVLTEDEIVLHDEHENDDDHDVHLSPQVSHVDTHAQTREGSARDHWLGTPLPDPPPLDSRKGTGIARQDYTDGPFVVTPARSRRPPWI